MKVNPTPGPIHHRYGGLTLSTLPSGVTSGQTSVINFNSPSQAYQQMNAQIIRLDQQYAGLSPAQHAAWDAAAATISSTAVCGCLDSAMNGQTMCRLLNYMGSLLGNPFYVAPPIPGATPVEWVSGIFRALSVHQIVLQFFVGEQPGYSIIQIGLGLGNPYFHLTDPPGVAVLIPGDPFFDELWNTPDNPTSSQCLWDQNLWPRGTHDLFITTIP